jgi:hypothetical protein
MVETIMVALGVYAISSLIVHYEGPFGIFHHIRSVKHLQSLTNCVVCTSFYITLPFLFIVSPLQALAAYGIVIVLTQFEP